MFHTLSDSILTGLIKNIGRLANLAFLKAKKAKKRVKFMFRKSKYWEGAAKTLILSIYKMSCKYALGNQRN